MQEDTEELIIAFSMFKIRQSRKTKRFDSCGSWFWHTSSSSWKTSGGSFFFPPFLRGALSVVNVLVHAAVKQPRWWRLHSVSGVL